MTWKSWEQLNDEEREACQKWLSMHNEESMSGKSARQIRKGFNALQQDRKDTARDLIAELEAAPFKFRFLFAMKLIFRRRKCS